MKAAIILGLTSFLLTASAQEVDLKVDPGALKAWRVARANYQAQEADVPGGKPGETWTRQRWLWATTPSTVKYYWPEWGYFELAPDQYSAVAVVRAEPVPWDQTLTAGDTVTVRWRVTEKGKSDVAVPVTALVRNRDDKGLELVVPVHLTKLSAVSRKEQLLTLDLPGAYSVSLTAAAVAGLRGKLP